MFDDIINTAFGGTIFVVDDDDDDDDDDDVGEDTCVTF